MDIQQKIITAESIFKNGFLCGKSLYMFCYGKVPNAHFINNIDGEKAYHAVHKAFADCIESVHAYRCYDTAKKGYAFDETFLRLKNGCLLEFDKYYCAIYHDGSQQEFINTITNTVQQFKEPQRRKSLEMNLISRTNYGFELKQIEVKKTRLDISLFYNEDFKAVDELITKRLKKDKDKGIVLLHGLPGTGKTTYLRYLIGKIKKRILFVSPTVAGDITSPDFIQLLIDNPNSVLIIEDAENILMDRKISNNASVSNLLNLSDGLLADFLNVQLICTFNSPLTMVDSALIRKGRLIAKYEFGKLNIEKAQQLSNHFGFAEKITKPMTIAEIANPGKDEMAQQRTAVLGFRREVLMN